MRFSFKDDKTGKLTLMLLALLFLGLPLAVRYGRHQSTAPAAEEWAPPLHRYAVRVHAPRRSASKVLPKKRFNIPNLLGKNWEDTREIAAEMTKASHSQISSPPDPVYEWQWLSKNTHLSIFYDISKKQILKIEFEPDYLRTFRKSDLLFLGQLRENSPHYDLDWKPVYASGDSASYSAVVVIPTTPGEAKLRELEAQARGVGLWRDGQPVAPREWRRSR